MTYDIEDVREYVEGFLWSEANKKALSMNEILTMLKNALASIEDGDDGLSAYIERKKYYENTRQQRLGN
jgi:hypothetical protein